MVQIARMDGKYVAISFKSWYYWWAFSHRSSCHHTMEGLELLYNNNYTPTMALITFLYILFLVLYDYDVFIVDWQKLALVHGHFKTPINAEAVPLCSTSMNASVAALLKVTWRAKCRHYHTLLGFIFDVKSKTDITVLCKTLGGATTWKQCPSSKSCLYRFWLWVNISFSI